MWLRFAYLSISVRAKGTGEVTLEANKRFGRQMSTSPVKFSVNDSPEVTQLKGLISTMVNFEESERPTIDQVLQKLETIMGK